MNGLRLVRKHLVASPWCSEGNVLIGYTDDKMTFTVLDIVLQMKCLVKMPKMMYSQFSGSARFTLFRRV